MLRHRGLLDALPRGRALDVACGLGRNALYLAGMGFEVDAIDVSEVAVAHTQRLADERELPVRARVVDLAAQPVPEGPYEVVVDTFFLERRIVADLAAALAPGALLLFDTFLAEGDADTRYRLLPGELPRMLGELHAVAYEEGPPEPGGRPRVRMAARRTGTRGRSSVRSGD